MSLFFFFFNDTATTEIYTLSLHDALPICGRCWSWAAASCWSGSSRSDMRPYANLSLRHARARPGHPDRSEEHTSELQSRSDLVCRLLLEKKKKRRPAERAEHPQRCGLQRD